MKLHDSCSYFFVRDLANPGLILTFKHVTISPEPPYETKEVTFTQRIELPLIGVIIGIIMTIIGVTVIYVITSKDKITGLIQKYKGGINK